MALAAAQLLRLLGSGVNALRPAAPAPPVDKADFAQLLQQARSGEVRTDLPVTVENDAGVSLTPAELTRLCVAADRAEAAGIRTALVLLDGKAVLLDVHTRSVKGAVSLGEGQEAIVPGIDGLIDLRTAAGGGGEDAPGGPPTISEGPGGGAPIGTDTMMRLLASGLGR